MWFPDREPFRHFPEPELERLLRGLADCGAVLEHARWSAACASGGRVRGRLPASALVEVLDAAEQGTGGSHPGLDAAGRTEPTDLLHALCAAQPTLGASLREFQSFQALLFGTKAFTLHREASGLRVAVRAGPRPDAMRHLVEYYVRTMCREAINLVGPVARPLEVRFVHTPADCVTAYRDAFTCRVAFCAPESTVLFSRRAVDARNPRANRAIAAELRRLAREQLAALPGGSVAERAAELIESAVISRAPIECDTVARQLGMSVRTLQRRLAEEQQTFCTVRDEVRERTLVRLANAGSRTPATVAELADAVGYEEPASLCRALRRWRGVRVSTLRMEGETAS